MRSAQRLVELAQHINATAGRQQVTTIDIGGGLAAYYCPSLAPNPMITMAACYYADYLLRSQVPALFSSNFRIITELRRRMGA